LLGKTNCCFLSLSFQPLIRIEVTDLSATSDSQALNELTVSGKQLPGLVKLTKLTGLKRLIVIEQAPVDLSPIGQLTGLEYLWLWIVHFDLKPLHSLVNLHELMLSGGIGLDRLSDVTDIQVLGDLKELRILTIGSFNINNISFVAQLGNLEELNISRMPITSIAPLRSLSSLKSVTLALTGVTDISPLLELPLLEKVNVMRTPARADVLTELERRGVNVRR